MEEPLLTLEPLIEAVREGVEGLGWVLSGLQKTTSHQFEGRWEGDSTRSAYLFFHSDDEDESASIDVYLDETSRGLTGNLALVMDLAVLGELGDVTRVLDSLRLCSERTLSEEWKRPLTLRFRLPDASVDGGEAEAEVRFKVRIPRRTIEAGSSAVGSLCAGAVTAFEGILDSRELERLGRPE